MPGNILLLDWDSGLLYYIYLSKSIKQYMANECILLHTNYASMQFTSKNEGTLLTLLDLLGKSHVSQRRIRDASVETMRTFYFTSLGEQAGASLDPWSFQMLGPHPLWIPFLEF